MHLKDEQYHDAFEDPIDSTAGSGLIPGISDARELNGNNQPNSDSESEEEGGEGPLATKHLSHDAEAHFKNLEFQGVPNSTLSAAADEPTGDEERDEQSNWLKKMYPQDSFYGWRKEMGQAFRRFSKLTGRRNTRSDIGKNVRSSVSHHQSPEDMFTQSLASDLIDTLISGCPAALFAGCSFLRDEHGVRRAPILLAMLGVKVKPSKPHTSFDTNMNDADNGNGDAHESQRHDAKFKLELEYGVGYNRLKWAVVKSYKDLASLHTKLKLMYFQQNAINKLHIDNHGHNQLHLPHFPRFDDLTKKERNTMANELAAETSSTDTRDSEVPAGAENQNHNDAASLATGGTTQFEIKKFRMKHLEDLLSEQDDSSHPMHQRLERYLKLLNLALCLRPQSNRLFQFYELSPIGNLLSYENGYQGKQGYMVVRSTASAQGWRVSHFKFRDFRAMIERHTNKWFLVRHSYILYVSDLHSTTPLDVFLVDSSFKIRVPGEFEVSVDDYKDFDPMGHDARKISTKLQITLENSERKIQMLVKSEFQLRLWVASLSKMVKSTIWSQKKRFDSFAPVRRNCFCKYLVDGRDYFWALSEALSMAQDVIFIHDWWLSPELYMRRPVKANQEYRIDRILRERAEKGVKIFIVVYRNVGSTVGTDSSWTKHSMLNLHPNIHLIRSPNQWLQNTYFWAHHEKMTVIDHSVAFMGGIDLCYGRFDTPEHVLKDDDPDLQNQNFPGKDYSNARVCDFYDLDKPFESMYDRNVVPRMPWHDVHMMTVGEAARDMSRHFVQRWNYVIRQKRPSRPTPLLTPPSDFTESEMKKSPFFQDIADRSTCEVQVLRSAGNWSLGLKKTEHSIQNAYLKLIETSNHFVYMENQFFVTSSSWDGVVVENKIGDALVDRIIKASSEGKAWKAFIVIPLMPGFDSPIDKAEGSSVRVIMQCQFQSISRGETSIFARLRKLDIDPLQHIQFFSLRKWSALGPNDRLVTEQLYVHGKVLIADDRACIIGSANINERSMLGNRDSEVAALVRDTDLVESKMGDKPYLAGRFAWELRQRLMREHLGCDVDIVEVVERKFGKLEELAKLNYKTLHLSNDENNNKKAQIESALIEIGYREVMHTEASEAWKEKYGSIKNFGLQIEPGKSENEDSGFQPVENNNVKSNLTSTKQRKEDSNYNLNHYHSFNNRAGEANLGIRDKKPISTDSRLVNNEVHTADVDGLGLDGWKKVSHKLKQNVTEKLRSWAEKMLVSTADDKVGGKRADSFLPHREDVEIYLDDFAVTPTEKWDMLKRICYLQYLSHKNDMKINSERSENESDSSISKSSQNPDTTDGNSHKNHVEAVEEHELDDEIIDDMLMQLLPPVGNNGSQQKDFLNLKFVDPYAFEDPLCDAFYEDMWFAVALRNTMLFRLVFHCQPDNSVQTWRDYKDFNRMREEFDSSQDTVIDLERYPESEQENAMAGKKSLQPQASRKEDGSSSMKTAHNSTAAKTSVGHQDYKSRSRALKMKLSNSVLYGANQRIFDKYTARRILERVHGHLVIFPTDWLAREVESNNWFYSADRLPPIDIYD
ncbi:LANO_0B07470g1_1 [Lachancea nothofagi CBS 11611]|uniref:Phospholipase n=1 Tax=Lachancea nothofagi CBS 11611 TaxID=1266666 RepID=A0A1G4J0A3_9SACH|nr:LANO_0B07470g1_1 [Lachancea nothofagi CBS 11611]